MKNVARLIVANARDAEQLERDERVRPAAPSGSGTRSSATTPIASAIQATGSCPRVRLAADHAEREAADGERGDERAEPVEAPGRLGVARLRDVAQVANSATTRGAAR